MTFEKFVPLKPGEMILDANDGEIRLDDFFSAKKFYDSRGSQPSQIKNCRHVELYFDAEQRALGIKPVEKPKKRDPSVYKATQHGAELRIRCPSFLWLCQISSGESYRLRATWSQKEGMLIARLEDEI